MSNPSHKWDGNELFFDGIIVVDCGLLLMPRQPFIAVGFSQRIKNKTMPALAEKSQTIFCLLFSSYQP
jgi:hypothetical protein